MDYRGRHGYESRADMGMSLRHMNISVNMELDVHYVMLCASASLLDEADVDMNLKHIRV